MIALFGWDASGVTAGATVVLGVLAAVATIANALLVRASVKQGVATEKAAQAAQDAVVVQQQQVALARDELRLVERQVAAMERQVELQESESTRRARQAFPQLEVESSELATDEVRGKVRYIHGEDAADAVEVWIWFRGRQYVARIGQVLATPTGTDFRATPPVEPVTPEAKRIPDWVLTRGPRVDAVSWLGKGVMGAWWAQRFDEHNNPIGFPERGEWERPGFQRVGDAG